MENGFKRLDSITTTFPLQELKTKPDCWALIVFPQVLPDDRAKAQG